MKSSWCNRDAKKSARNSSRPATPCECSPRTSARRLLRSRSLRRAHPERPSSFWGRRCRTLSQEACAFRARSREAPPRRLPACSRRWGATVHAASSTAHAGLAVFDEETVWFGTLPLLAFPRKDDCSIRFKSPEAAHDLLQETRLDEQGRKTPGEGDISGEESPRRGGRKAASGGSQRMAL